MEILEQFLALPAVIIAMVALLKMVAGRVPEGLVTYLPFVASGLLELLTGSLLPFPEGSVGFLVAGAVAIALRQMGVKTFRAGKAIVQGDPVEMATPIQLKTGSLL